jgi:acetyl-CoA acetyltransferase
MTAIRWGWSIEDTAARLMEESSKARENGERYALRTSQNAAAAVAERNQQRSRPVDSCTVVVYRGANRGYSNGWEEARSE